MSRHHLLLASAGTGKTYRLTHHLIDLLGRGEDPGRILASTFTRKAAGEIQGRVLERLAEGATDPATLTELNRMLENGRIDAARCRELLTDLVLNLDRFQVRTLDAFFVHVGHLFAFDLGLPAGWDIADEHQEVALIEEAIGRVLADSPPEELVELLRGVAREEGAQRSVRGAMRTVIGAARGHALEAEPGAWEALSAPPGLPEDTLRSLIGYLETVDLPKTAKGTVRANWQKNHAAMMCALEAGDWGAYLNVTLVQRVRDGEPAFDGVDIHEELRRAMVSLQGQARHALLSELVSRNHAVVRLLERFQGALDAVKRERGLLAFEDLPRALAPDGASGAAALRNRDLDLDYRLDARLDHLLLDEFQDTAPVQWRILERTTEEVLAEQDGTRTFFCVGDVKQSIYGWRSAEPRLLSGLADWYAGALEVESLVDNFRSSRIVLDTVNRVFGDVADYGGFEGPNREAAARWVQGFESHRARRDLPGQAVLLVTRTAVDEEWEWAPVLERLTERVRALTTEAPRATIGVLVRSNKPIPWILERFLSAGLRASGEGGNPLTDSRAVLHVLSALHLADHPGDEAAAFHLRHSPLWAALEGLNDGTLEGAAHASRFLRRRLSWESLGDLCTRLLPAVDAAEGYGTWDKRRFRQLVDLAYARGTREGARWSTFVDLVREKKVEDPATSRIKVMTVHASKGLEFDAVVLPELDESLAARGIRVLSHRPDPRRRYDVCSMNPGSGVAKLDPDLLALHEEQQQRMMEESLCVLYVAMTRAKHRLEMIVHSNSKRLTYGALLRDRLGASEPDPDGVLWRHPEGQDAWFRAEEGDSEAATDGGSGTQRLRLIPSSRLRESPSRTPSSSEGGGRVRNASALLRGEDRGQAHGTLIHRWMQEVEWLEAFALDDESLLALVAPLEPDLEVRQRALVTWRRQVGQPNTKQVLMSPRKVSLFETAEVWRERPFSVLLPDADGRPVLWNGAFDRVVVILDDGRPVRAELVDYKTDAVEGPMLAGRVEEYRPQLESYRLALSAITGIPVAAITAALLFLHSDQRIEV